MRIINYMADINQGEFYFTVKNNDGTVGKIQLNMELIINDFEDDIVWDEEVIA